MSERQTAITLDGVTRRFGNVQAVRGVSLEIYEAEFFTMLGPSGCGKTTTLRTIAGFENPDEGRVRLRGLDVTDVPPNRRNVNMVFQHYALFPHMSIYDNVAFGLKLKRTDKREQRKRVEEILDVVQLGGLERRRPHQLSGGQQQRVALARALINRPAALLLDEPFGALDVKLRKQLQLELKRVQAQLGTTFVHVTHDQEEALLMSDRIAVMNDGVVEQVGTPEEVYERPQTAFCASFIGALNTIDVIVNYVEDGNFVGIVAEYERIVVPVRTSRPVGARLKIAVRPECITLLPAGVPVAPDCSRLEGTLEEILYLGGAIQFHVDTAAGRLVSHRLNSDVGDGFQLGSRVVVTWAPNQCAELAT